jgi:hypothetical protein
MPTAQASEPSLTLRKPRVVIRKENSNLNEIESHGQRNRHGPEEDTHAQHHIILFINGYAEIITLREAFIEKSGCVLNSLVV